MKVLGSFTPKSKPLPAGLLKTYSTRDDLVFLLRHGQIPGGGKKRFLGITDLPLDRAGMDQAQYWKAALKEISFSGIYSSALDRCRTTAGIIAGAHPVITEPRLNEIHLGDWENRTFERIKTDFPDAFNERGHNLDTFRPPGGESFLDLSERVLPFFGTCLSPEAGSRLVITHAGVIRILLCHIKQIPVKRLFEFRPAYSQLFVIEK